jgi:hypothetical protein
VRKHRDVAGVDLDRGSAHALGEEPLKIGVHRAVMPAALTAARGPSSFLQGLGTLKCLSRELQRGDAQP